MAMAGTQPVGWGCRPSSLALYNAYLTHSLGYPQTKPDTGLRLALRALCEVERHPHSKHANEQQRPDKTHPQSI